MKLLLFIVSLCIFFIANAQSNDFFLLKKQSGRTVKTFYSGTYISFITNKKENYSGYIKKVAKDSVWIEYREILRGMTGIRSIILDTVTYEARRFAIKDIAYIKKDSKGFQQAVPSALLKIGGAGYILLHTLNGIIQKEKISVRNISIAAAAYLAGVLLNKLKKDYYYTGKRYRLHYISLAPNTHPDGREKEKKFIQKNIAMDMESITDHVHHINCLHDTL